jgi:hypothetical protein
LLSAVLIGSLAGALGTFLLPQRFRGEAVIRVDWGGQGSSAGPGESDPGRRREALRGDLLDPDRLGRLLDVLARADPASRALPGPDSLSEDLAVVPRTAGAWGVRYTAPDPETAVLVPNLLIALLVEETDRERGRRLDRGPDARARLLAARRAVDEAEAAVLKERRRAVQGTPRPPADIERALRSQREAVEAALSQARERAREIERAIDAASRLRPGESPSRAELDRLEARLADLRQRYTDQHPDVEAVRRRMEELEAEVPDSRDRGRADLPALRAELSELETDVGALEAEREDLDARISAAARPSDRPSGSPEALLVAQRQLGRAREAYAAALEGWEAGRRGAERGSTAPRYTLVESADGARSVYPGPWALAVAGAALGFAVWLLAAALAERWGDEILDAEDVDPLLGKPLLASIPLLSRRSSRPVERP